MTASGETGRVVALLDLGLRMIPGNGGILWMNISCTSRLAKNLEGLFLV
jgi:hypothetical protein